MEMLKPVLPVEIALPVRDAVREIVFVGTIRLRGARLGG
jgi:hypothetical protein